MWGSMVQSCSRRGIRTGDPAVPAPILLTTIY
ncbi:hypothetical protein RHECNPAF_9300135 [Rhizobium etli CNPAF512]|nr:hypothetical protein RHECNPAF_9300135 [Rhizobium etli CNPAF512]